VIDCASRVLGSAEFEADPAGCRRRGLAAECGRADAEAAPGTPLSGFSYTTSVDAKEKPAAAWEVADKPAVPRRA
jgi:hypothetical protein